MKAFIKRLLFDLGYRVQGTRYTPRQLLDPGKLRMLELGDVICRRMVERGAPLNFVQVGAFDGVTADPLRPYILAHGWRGVFIEPQPRAVEKLRELYRDRDGMAILQAAVDRAPGQRTLYWVDSPSGPAWAGGLASFDREIILKNAELIPGLSGMIREELVECITFDTVLSHLPSAPLDLLQIDVEGADAQLLSLFPFERVRPAIVHFEVKHLDKTARECCLDRLDRSGYRFAPSGSEDMLAVLTA